MSDNLLGGRRTGVVQGTLDVQKSISSISSSGVVGIGIFSGSGDGGPDGLAGSGERGCRTLSLAEVVRHLEKIRRKNNNNLRCNLRRRSRSPEYPCSLIRFSYFSCVLIMWGFRWLCWCEKSRKWFREDRRNEGKGSSGDWRPFSYGVEGGFFFVTFLRARLVSSFHCWYSCQRLMSEAETSLGSSSSSSVRSTASEYFLLSLGDSRPIKASQASS